MDIYCRIKIKDTTKTITTQIYSSPQKYWEAWWALIQSHEDASQIRLSNSEHALPSFLTPKADSMALPPTLGKQLPYVKLKHNSGFLPPSPCRQHPSQLCERQNLEPAGYDKFFLSDSHSSWWYSPDCNHHTTWPVQVDSNATKTEKCTSYAPALNECCPETSNWENMPHIHQWHCNLVKLNHRTCQTHQYGHEGASQCETFLWQKEVSVLHDGTQLPGTPYLCMWYWTELIQNTKNIEQAHTWKLNRCPHLSRPCSLHYEFLTYTCQLYTCSYPFND